MKFLIITITILVIGNSIFNYQDKEMTKCQKTFSFDTCFQILNR